MAVSDGTFTYTPPTFPPPSIFLFANAPREILEQALREHNLRSERWTEWISPYICLLIDTGEQRVLVDTGADGLGPGTGKLVQNLMSEGISPQDVDAVILVTDIRTTSVGTQSRESQLSQTHASSFGRTSGTSGLQGRRS
jgi:hypothetical protein